jgi:putative membrane protein
MLVAMKLLARWLLLACVLMVLPYVTPKIELIDGFGVALLVAFVLGLLNTFVRPVLVILTLPVTLLTLGLFLFVINAGTFWLAGYLLDGFNVHGIGAALLGSMIYSFCSLVIDAALERVFTRRAP